jgi:hypothetical protein
MRLRLVSMVHGEETNLDYCLHLPVVLLLNYSGEQENRKKYLLRLHHHPLVEYTVLDSLCYVRFFYLFLSFEIGDGS